MRQGTQGKLLWSADHKTQCDICDAARFISNGLCFTTFQRNLLLYVWFRPPGVQQQSKRSCSLV